MVNQSIESYGTYVYILPPANDAQMHKAWIDILLHLKFIDYDLGNVKPVLLNGCDYCKGTDHEVETCQFSKVPGWYNPPWRSKVELITQRPLGPSPLTEAILATKEATVEEGEDSTEVAPSEDMVEELQQQTSPVRLISGMLSTI
jgi:hypothetical protein